MGRKRDKGSDGATSTSTTEGAEMGGIVSTSLSQNVPLRPSMSEYYMMLGGFFIDLLKYGRICCKESAFLWTGKNQLDVMADGMSNVEKLCIILLDLTKTIL